MKQIALLGSTGSIGKSTLKVVQHLEGQFRVRALAAHSNVELLSEQARQFKPDLVAIFDKSKALDLQKRLPGMEVVAGMEGLIAAATLAGVSQVVSAMSGTAGLLPTAAAIESGKDIALANKEVLVAAGEYITHLVKKKNVKLLPVDSEHSAIFQCLNGESKQEVRRLVLTSSGGPFRTKSFDDLEKVTLEDALKHPNWSMGPKITIDSSTLMNKGLEVIEAKWLFDMDPEKIDVVIHPQSIVHSMVEFIDGSIIAQMSKPDMILPIQYALTYPERKSGLLPPFDFIKNSVLEFSLPDLKKFVCLHLAIEALKTGGSYPCFLNAANEVLVGRFLNKEFSWKEIGLKLSRLIEGHAAKRVNSLNDILAVDSEARQEALKE